MSVQIRTALTTDSIALAQIQVDSYQTAYRGILPDEILDSFSYSEQEQDWQDWMQEKPSDQLLVAEAESREIVGYALSRMGRTKLEPYDGEVMALHVRTDFQHRGIGRALFMESARGLQALGSLSLLVWVLELNHPAIRFYQRMGGKATGRQVLELEKDGSPLFELAYGWLDIGVLCE